MITIYTDGACSGNPGPGGWGAVLIFKKQRKEIKGGELETTNNRMELTAAIEALSTLKQPCQIELYTDSNYLRHGITNWIKKWKHNNWRTSNNKPVKNIDLWQRLEETQKHHNINWHWIKSHTGHPENERADTLAQKGMTPFTKS